MLCLHTATHWVLCDSPDLLGNCADSSAVAYCGSVWGVAAGELAARVYHDDAELCAALLAVIRDVCGDWAPVADQGAPALVLTWHPRAHLWDLKYSYSFCHTDLIHLCDC